MPSRQVHITSMARITLPTRRTGMKHPQLVKLANDTAPRSALVMWCAAATDKSAVLHATCSSQHTPTLVPGLR